VPRRPSGPSDPTAGPGQGQEHVDAPSSLFANAQEEQQLWEELCGHGASLNRALNESLQIHDGPAWHVFQVCRRCFFPSCCHFRICLCDMVLMDFVCWRQELEPVPVTGTAPSTR
jgi:hypothetical protein